MFIYSEIPQRDEKAHDTVPTRWLWAVLVQLDIRHLLILIKEHY